MACENDKCETYGMHHEYKNGVEVRKCQSCREEEKFDVINEMYLSVCRIEGYQEGATKGLLLRLEAIEKFQEDIWKVLMGQLDQRRG